MPTNDPEREKQYNSKAYKDARRAVLRRDGGYCMYCGKPGNTVDHIIPLNKGGAVADVENMVTACKPCNSSKQDKLLIRLAYRNPKYFPKP
jgi:5-methylcytosine-specific restriction endonuclease McrA